MTYARATALIRAHCRPPRVKLGEATGSLKFALYSTAPRQATSGRNRKRGEMVTRHYTDWLVRNAEKLVSRLPAIFLVRLIRELLASTLVREIIRI